MSGSRGTRGVMLCLALVAMLVPTSRRRDWLEQWRAELWHYEQWLAGEGASVLPRFLRVLARATGAVPHAFTIRLLQWSPRMFINDLTFAWRMFGGLTAKQIADLRGVTERTVHRDLDLARNYLRLALGGSP